MKRDYASSLPVALAAVAVGLILISVPVNGQEWNQWMGSGRDGKIAGFKSPQKWPSSLVTEWKTEVGTGDATPVMVGKRLFSFSREGSEEVVRCIALADGKEIWKQTYQAEAVTGPAQSHPGPRSTPSVSGNKIITFGVTGILSCFDIESGKLLWRKENPDLGFPQFFTGMSPLIDNNLCIIHLGSKDNGELAAIDINDGKTVWKWAGEGPAYGSPVLMTVEGTRMVALLTEKSLTLIGLADGKNLLQVPTTIASRFYNAATPVIDGNKIYLTGQGQGIRALRIIKTGSSYSADELWTTAAAGTKWNTPIIKNGFLFGLSDLRKLFCVNAENGELAWMDEAVNHDFGTIVDAGEVLIALPASANLIFYRPDNVSYTELARYKVSETPVFTFPLVFGNRIIVKDAAHITCYKIE